MNIFLFRRIIYGPNLIRTTVKSFMTLLFLEFTNPYNVFQIFSLGLWLLNGYTWYAAIIAGISLGSIGISVKTTKKVCFDVF